MLVTTHQKYVKITPRKMRLVADVVRKMDPHEAIEVLPFMPQRGSLAMSKVLKTALANVRDQGMSDNDVKIKTLEVTEGPVLKRFRPVSRGRAHGYQRRMSHIRLVVEVPEAPAKEGKNESKKEVKEVKKSKKGETKK